MCSNSLLWKHQIQISHNVLTKYVNCETKTNCYQVYKLNQKGLIFYFCYIWYINDNIFDTALVLWFIIMSPPRMKGDILFQSEFFFCFFRCFSCCFSVKLVQTITFLFKIGQWYLVYWCMTRRQYVAYLHDICLTLTFDPKVK